MRYKKSILAVIFAAVAVYLGSFDREAEASQRYGYRSYSYRTSHYRPTYRGYGHYRPTYRPYYRPYNRAYFRPYSYWGYRPRPYYYGFSYSRPAYYAGGQTGYSYQSGAVRTKIKPKTAEVYVDGYYAGIVDDFDGSFQKLYMPPGQHEIEVRLEGHRSYRQTLLVNSGATTKIHHQMEPLGPGESNPPPPEPRKPQHYLERHEEPTEREPERSEVPPPLHEPRPYRSETPAPPQEGSEEEAPRERLGTSTAAARFGTLSLRVKPADAEIIIDGERWGTVAGFEQMTVHLPAGRHRVEIRKNGYQTFVTDVDIQQGAATPLNVSLVL